MVGAYFAALGVPATVIEPRSHSALDRLDYLFIFHFHAMEPRANAAFSE